MIRILLLISSIVVVQAVSSAQESDVKQIQNVLDLQMAAWNKGDIAGYMDGYWRSDSLIFTSGGRVTRGWKSTYRNYVRTYDSAERMGKLTFGDIEIVLLSQNSAWVLGKWNLERASDKPHGIFTLIFRRIPGGWKIIHDHTSLAE